MGAPRWPVALAAGLVLLGTAAAVTAGVAPAEPAPAGGQPTDGIAAQTASDGVDPDRVVIEVALRADGSAHWSIAHRVRLDDPNVTNGFERTRKRLERNRSAFRGPFARQVRAMATEAQESTGRTMVVENVSIEASRTRVPREYGVIEYSFRWYGFAATDQRLRAGDALSELFLDADTTLIVSWPGNATLAEVGPRPDDRRRRSVIWNGPVEFARNEPRVVVESDSLSWGPDPPPPVPSDDLLVTVFALSLVVGTVGVGVWRRKRSDDDTGPTDTPTAPETEAGTGTASGSSLASGEADTGPDAADPAPPEELLSNEEQLLALLDERDGRMKQQTVAGELDWSETKTSEVVSDLREAGEIEVYRLGRENVLALPDTGLGIDTEDGEA